MDSSAAIARTAAGTGEIKERRFRLNPKQRALLILIDGSRTAAFHREQARRLGLPADTLDELQGLGLVGEPEPVAAAAVESAAAAPGEAVQRFMAARQLMNDAVVDALGLRAFFFTLKIERTGNLDDLRGLLPEYTRQLRRAHGPEVADELIGRAGQLLAE